MSPIYLFDGWRFDTGRRELMNPEGKIVRLSAGQMTLLRCFCERPRQLVTVAELIEAHGNTRSGLAIQIQLHRLRRLIARKFRQNKFVPQPKIMDMSPIKTIRFRGYWLEPEVTVESPEHAQQVHVGDRDCARPGRHLAGRDRRSDGHAVGAI